MCMWRTKQCGGRFTYLMNCPKEIPRNKDFLWNLLQQKDSSYETEQRNFRRLGFIKLELRNDVLYENNKRIDIVRFEEIRDTMRNYIITEYAYQHHELAQIWPDSECTLRIIMCKNPTDDRYALPHGLALFLMQDSVLLSMVAHLTFLLVASALVLILRLAVIRISVSVTRDIPGRNLDA